MRKQSDAVKKINKRFSETPPHTHHKKQEFYFLQTLKAKKTRILFFANFERLKERKFYFIFQSLERKKKQ